MPPMKVTQRPAPQAVAKARRWTSLAAAAARPSPLRRSASGAKRTPAARNETAVRNRAAHPIARDEDNGERERERDELNGRPGLSSEPGEEEVSETKDGRRR
nr:unnamed protein product [Digitaria exilis]